MKSKFKGALVLSLLFAYFNGQSQDVEIIPSYGYQFGSKLKYGSNYLKAKDSDQYGLSVGVLMDEYTKVELAYTRMATELRIRDIIISPTEDRLSDLNFDWVQLGATRYFQTGKVRPFGGGGLGLVVISPQDVNLQLAPNGLSSTTRFAVSFKAGVNFMFSDRVGFNIQGDLFLPIQWGGVYVGGGGSGISAGTTTVMGSVSGGLVFLLGEL